MHVLRGNLQRCDTWCKFLNRFRKLATRCSTPNIAEKSSATGCYTRTIFRGASHHCKSAIDQCNTTFMRVRFSAESSRWEAVPFSCHLESTNRFLFCFSLTTKGWFTPRTTQTQAFKHKPRVNRYDASTSARSFFLVLASSRFTRGLCLCLCLRRTSTRKKKR